MSRRIATPNHVFLWVIGLTVVVSLLPLRYIGWVSDIASIVKLPAYPFADAGTRARVWLAGGPEAQHNDQRSLEQLRDEADRFRVLYNDSVRQLEELQSTTRELQLTRQAGTDTRFEPVIANVVGRNTAGGGLTLDLNVGRWRHRVYNGAVAVYRGTHLIGRVSAVSRMGSILVPITDSSIKFIEAAVAHPAPPTDRAGYRPPRVLLEPQTDGLFLAEVRADLGIAVNDYAMLRDPQWPATAQSMIIGTVVEVRPHGVEPLMRIVVVRPQYDVGRVPSVTIKLETTELAQGSDGGLG